MRHLLTFLLVWVLTNTVSVAQLYNPPAGNTSSGANQGEIRLIDRTTDSGDWILLDGRLKSSLTAAQQTVATALGYGTNLPDMRGRLPIGAGGTAGIAFQGIGGTVTIAQNNLPNVVLSHTHSITDPGHTHNIVHATNANFNGGQAGSTPFGSTNHSSGNATTGISVNSGGPNLNGGVTQQNYLPPVRASNWFVWLGPASPTVTMQQALNVTTTGTSGEATFNSGTGVLNIPNYTSSSPIRVNNSLSETAGLYRVAVCKFPNTGFEFFQDQYFRFDHNGNAFRIAAVGTAKSIGVYGFNSGSANASLPVSTNSIFVGVGGYGSIAVGVFTTISNAGLSNDYDDIQTFWIQCASAPVKYRVTILGGSAIGAIVERWDMSVIAANVKITFP
jgi:hypothetical protein